MHAQTTKFMALSYPRQVEYQSPEPAVVEITVSYQNAKAGYLLVVGLFNDEKRDYLKGTATGSPDPCLLPPTLTTNTSCIVKLQAASGQEHVTFRFSTTENPHALGTWRLLMESGLESSERQVVSGSFFSHRFSVVVIPSITIQTSSQVPKTEATTPLGGGVSLIVAAIIVVGLVAISLVYLTRRQKRTPEHGA